MKKRGINKKKFLVIISKIIYLVTFSNTVFSQSIEPSTNVPSYHILDKLHITTSTSFFSSFKPYRRKDIGKILQSIPYDSLESKVMKNDYNYLSIDNWEYADNRVMSKKPFLKKLYKRPADLFFVKTPSFSLHINPIISLGGGLEVGVNHIMAVRATLNYRNTRGLYMYGRIGKNVGFYTYLTENQVQFPFQVENFPKSVPFAGAYKPLVPTISAVSQRDFMAFRGHLDIDVSPYMNLQFGHGKHFIGEGYRSLILSDFSNNYLFLKFQTRVWKIQYTNLFARLNAQVLSPNQVFPVKYLALHHLSIQLKNVNIGLSEAVIIGRPNQQTFDIAYLNPIIFYRGVEFHRGSADNILINLDFSWNIWKRVQLYGQLSIDELVISELFSSRDWWGKKLGTQLGVKYMNVFNLKNLDMQVECNFVRPFTYSHHSGNAHFTNYQHYDLPLAHPMGANFLEFLVFFFYQPHPKIQIDFKAFFIQKGHDVFTDDNNEESRINYGGNIFLDSNTRSEDYNHTSLQGDKVPYLIIKPTVSYQWRHNLFFDVSFLYRRGYIRYAPLGDLPVKNENIMTTYLSIGLRWNFPKRDYMF